jgi:selenium-binding protein 1
MSHHTHEGECCTGPGYALPQEAMQAQRKELLYTVALYRGTGIQAPHYLASVDVDPTSPTYSQVIHRTRVIGLDEELHRFG